MFKLTPYSGTGIFLVIILGLAFPWIGYLLFMIVLTILVISSYRGVWFYNNISINSASTNEEETEDNSYKQVNKRHHSFPWLMFMWFICFYIMTKIIARLLS